MPLLFTLCADDYGMTDGVSRGILEAAVAGRINAASAMTSMPDWPRAAEAWRDAAPPAQLGLHFNLTLGAPLGEMPRVAPGGRFPAIGQIVRNANPPQDEISAEFSRQIAAFVEATGHAPAHVDGHQHVHVLRGVREALFQSLREAGLAGVPVRDSGEQFLRIIRRPCIGKALSVALLARGFGNAAQSTGFPLNDGFAGFSAFDPVADPEPAFAKFLAAPGKSHLVMCHPGHVDESLRTLDPVTTARENELCFLLSDRWPALLERSGAALRTVP